MIDTHVHFRDLDQWRKETIYHGILTAYKAGLDGIFEMPNTSPVITTRKAIDDRLALGDVALRVLELGNKFFHGVYGGVTAEKAQIEEMMTACIELERVVGIKMFSGNSTGDMGLIKVPEQGIVYKTAAEANFTGTIVNHMEKESLMKPGKFNYKNPISHTWARPPEAETGSLRDQIELAERARFKGTLHMAHLSVPESYHIIEDAKQNVGFKLTCEVAPHHAVLYDSLMNVYGHNLKMNPPLRTQEMQEEILDLVLTGKIDMIATDHAPHRLVEKMGIDPMSGVPGLPFYPKFIGYLQEKGISSTLLEDITHNNALKIFGIDAARIPNTYGANRVKGKELNELANEYEFNAFEKFYD